jgi:hypothetical protein
MGNSNSYMYTHFTLVSVNYIRNSFEKLSSCENEKLCPLDIMFDPEESTDKIKLLYNNTNNFEIYGLNSIMYVNKNEDFSYLSYIQDKINSQQRPFFVIVWKQNYNKQDYNEVIKLKINKKYFVNINEFSGKDLKIFFTGLGSVASLNVNKECKKYIFLPTNALVKKYNKYIIYDTEGKMLYGSPHISTFEFEKHKNYTVFHFYEIK